MKVYKTSFEKEQQEKDEAFLQLSPIERLDKAREVRRRMKRNNTAHSFEGMVVRISKTL